MSKFVGILFFLFNGAFVNAQLKNGDLFPNITTAEALNLKSKEWSLYSTKANLYILDYFGTWCAPCIKAIPQLKNYATKFGSDIAISLISKESVERLEKFVAAQKDLPFPVLADVNLGYHDVAQPPSYPFTVVLSKSYKVLAITSTSDIDETQIAVWIAQSKNETSIDMPVKDTIKKAIVMPSTPIVKANDNNLLQLSQNFLLAVKSNEDVRMLKTQLASLPSDTLLNYLKSNDEKIAFWLNMYNAFTNETLKTNPDQYKNRKAFFKNKFITIAGKLMSLDDIEHGILRRSKHKLSMGYFNKWFKSDFEKQHRVAKLDWRIHFALNCGAKSCPPIAFYTAHNLNTELELATKNYLTGESEWNANADVVKVPILFSWFRKDFGGKKQIIPILQKYNIVGAGNSPKVKFKKYDWNLLVENYKK